MSDTPTGLYQATEILRAEKHAGLRLRKEPDYRFAAPLVSVPVALTEMPVLQRHYPIVFAGSEAPVPVALLGFSQERGNNFVDADGRWEEHLPIPAFFRRYPLIALNVSTGEAGESEKRMMLAADVASDKLSREEGTPFFENGQATETAREVFEECVRMHRDFELAAELGRALAGAGVLQTREVELKINTGDRMGMRNFELIDEEKLNALPVETLADWRGKGFLPGLYAQLMSLGSWQSLARRAMAPPAQEDETATGAGVMSE